jgi:transposase InsO family protein
MLSIRGQCRLLGIARSGVYRPAPANDDADLALMRRIDALFTAWPFLGSRRLTAMLRAEGITVNRKRVQRLMRAVPLSPRTFASPFDLPAVLPSATACTQPSTSSCVTADTGMRPRSGLIWRTIRPRSMASVLPHQ